MRTLLFLSLASYLFAATLYAEDAKPEAGRVQAELDRVAKMTPAEQQAWLVQLEDRAIHAIPATLEADEVARRQDQIRALLHQKTVTWQMLRELLEKIAPRDETVAKPQIAKKPQAVTKPADEKVARTIKKPTETAKTHTTMKPEVEVNLDELAARIAGSNLGFRTIESDLDEKGLWNAERLEPLADRLKVLVLRRSDLELFRDLAPEDRRASVGRLALPKSAISQLGERIAEARKAALGEEFQGSDAERQAELDRLDSLSRLLAELTGK